MVEPFDNNLTKLTKTKPKRIGVYASDLFKVGIPVTKKKGADC